eukprot:2851107-Rhodomonas_salina.3
MARNRIPGTNCAENSWLSFWCLISTGSAVPHRTARPLLSAPRNPGSIIRCISTAHRIPPYGMSRISVPHTAQHYMECLRQYQTLCSNAGHVSVEELLRTLQGMIRKAFD